MQSKQEQEVPVDPQLAVLADILDWSKDKPGWIREAIRMLVTQAGELSDDDINHLVLICKSETGIVQDPVKKVFFSKEHVAACQTPSVDVAVLGISGVKGVNALASNASLRFAPGLNIIYGDNGSGKSSYTRILKNSCRCAAPSVILTDVFAPPVGKEAKIAFVAGGAEHEFPWTEGAACPEHLNAIRIFDSRCADVYVNKEREASFTPYGIGVLSHLAERVCPRVKEALSQEQNALRPTLPDLTGVLPDQHASQWYKSLTAETRQNEVETWTQFTPDEEEELKRLAGVLGVADPQQRIIGLRSLIARIQSLAGALSAVEGGFSSQGIGRLKALVDDRNTKRLAADAANSGAFEGAPVPGTGSQVWRQLWDSARRFVELEAYPGVDFPNTQCCPLCQQELGAEAINRMNRFEVFIKGDAETQAQAAQKALVEYWERLFQVPVDHTPHAPLLNELGEVIAKRVVEFFQSAVAIRAELKSVAETNGWDKLPTLTLPPVQEMKGIVAKVQAEIDALSKTSDPNQRIAQQKRHDQLFSRKNLHLHQKAIVVEINRLIRFEQYREAIGMCNPTAISRKSGTLAEEHVTPELQRAFERRLKELFEGRGFVVLEKAKTSYGVTYFRLKLDGAVQDRPIMEIASEGEFRAIALAAFLAEVDLANDKSGVVFDDPVSSLDHRFREKFAKIVCEIALGRQVVIFTHDLFFLSRLTYLGKNLKPTLVPNCVELVSVARKHGYSRDGAPLEVKSFKERRKEILADIAAAKEKIGGDVDGYLRIASGLIIKMRKVTERVVEEVLFNGVIYRFDPAIHTTLLWPMLTTITSEDLQLFVTLMDRYSLYTHDQAHDRKAPTPDIGIMECDIESLQAWVTDYRKRV